MPLVYACVAPHGEELIPALAGRRLKDFSETRKGMKSLARDMADAAPDTLVIASPHNLRLLKHIGVVLSEYSTGTLEEGGGTVKLKAKCDLELGREVLQEAEERGLPVVGANYGALEGPMSDLAMDWGTLVPLWFLLGRRGRRILIVTPSRGIPLDRNVEFGKVIARVAEGSTKRVALVASADQAHAHRKDGPYGFSPDAKKYDRAVINAVGGGRVASLMKLDTALVAEAKPDSLWQMAILAGALSVTPMTGRVVSYQVPTYYGMMCATFQIER